MPLAAQEAPHSPGWVVISVPDYHALRIKAFPAEREPEPPPVDATLSRVEYELLADSGVASGRATLTVDVLKNGWVRVPYRRVFLCATRTRWQAVVARSCQWRQPIVRAAGASGARGYRPEYSAAD